MADQNQIEVLGKSMKFKDRESYVATLKENLMERIGTAQAIILMGKTPRSEIRKRLMNPKNPPGPYNPEFSYLEHAYVEELLNLAFAFNWDVVVEEQIWNGDDVELRGYLEVRFKDKMVVRKTGIGGAKYISSNPNMSRADAAKSAYSDMIKNAATKLGIGLDLYRHEEKLTETAIAKSQPQIVKADSVISPAEMKAIGKLLEQIVNAKDLDALEKIGSGIKKLIEDKKINNNQKKVLQESWASKHQKLQPKVKTKVVEEPPKAEVKKVEEITEEDTK